MTQEQQVEWRRHPEAEAFLAKRLDPFVAEMPPLQAFAARLYQRASGRLVDWLDHLVLADGEAGRGELAELGFEAEESPADPGDVVYHHPGAILPRIVLRGGRRPQIGVQAVAIQVEEVSRFLMAQQVSAAIEGSPLSPLRRARVWRDGSGREVLAVERRGYRGTLPTEMPADYPGRYVQALERWATRPRCFEDTRRGMEQTLTLARSLASDLGADMAAWVALAAERVYWQQRNRAGQVQKSRQDSLGLGWANHDHHTFRSSRDLFSVLIQILETLGFYRRERFYAGKEAKWGAQVMEQPACRFAVFADVDLAPEEVTGDFTRQPLPPRQELGTVGLWCALHGESMLTAGLHHLAGRFDFEAATAGLGVWGIEQLRPFSDFSYLRQAFTQGERWSVDPERLELLAAVGLIDDRQRARFAEQGAVGSHLENIQRREGFKGFNQTAVSDIIRRTDPRVG
ncbi:MAG: hypothetical protein JXM73_17320 [Anaerolineae bacterium]|nr:hypothetical protein [Anaerolineae bacterium]